MSAGSAYRVVTKAVLDELAERPGMAQWHVRYDPPRKRAELMNAAGKQMAVWADPEGSSSYEVTSFPTGYTETCSVSLTFQHSVETTSTLEAVDEIVDAALGELVDLLTDDPRLSGAALPEGWGISSITVQGTERTGDVMTDKPGAWRLVVVDLEATVSRC